MKNLITITSLVAAAAMTSTAFGAISTYDSTSHKIIWANTNENAVFKYVGAEGTNITFNTEANWNKGSTSNGAVTFPDTAVTGEPGRVNGGYLLYFDGNDKTMTFSGNGPDSSDGGGIWVSGTGNTVTVSLGGWAGSIQVDAGNILNTSWSSQLKDGHIVANGTVNITGGNLNFDTNGATDVRSWYTGANGQINIQKATGLSNASIEILGSGKTTFSTLTSIASGQFIEVKDTAKVDFGGQTVGGSGTLKLNAGTTLGNITLGALTLDLSALTLDNSTAKVTLDGNVSVTEDAVIKLGNVTEGETYKIFDTGVTGLDSLTYKNFSSDSVIIGGRSEITSADGALSITLGTVYSDLVWVGGESAVWNTTAGNKVWSRAEDSNNYDFANGDSVTFASAATVTVEGTVEPEALAVNESVTFTGTGTVAVDFDKLTIAENKTLSLSGNNIALDVSVEKPTEDNTLKAVVLSSILGDGVINVKHDELLLTDLKEVTLTLSNEFTGTLKLTNTQLDLRATDGTASSLGGATTVNLSNAALSFRYASQTFSKNIVVDEGKTGYFRVWSQNTTGVTISGDVSGSGTFQVMDGGKTIFSGAVNLGTLKVIDGSDVVFGSSDADATAATYTIGNILMATNSGTDRTFTINKNATVNADIFKNDWGVKTLTVDGILKLGDFLNSSGTTDTITGTGTINTGKLGVANVGTYVFDGGITINIGNGGIYEGESGDQGYTLQIKDATIGASADWSSSESIDDENIQLGEGAKFNTNGNTITLNSGLSNMSEVEGKLIKEGEGTLVLSGKNTYSGGTEIRGGTLKIDSAGWGTKGNLGTLFSSDGLKISNGGVLEVTAAQTADGDSTVYGTGGALRGFSVTEGKGTYRYSGEGESLISEGETNQRIAISSGATLVFDVVNANSTLTVSKIAQGEGALEINGAGTVVLSGTNTYTGGTTISAGTLVAGSTSALGTGAVTVSSGANLQAATGLTFSAETQTLTLKVSNAQKDSGAELITSSGSGSVTISGAAKVLIDISGLDLSGTEDIALHIAVDSALDANSSSFEVGAWNNDSQWIKDTSWFVSSYDSNSGTVTLSGAVPEPSAFGLLAGLGALALVGARRRRKTK